MVNGIAILEGKTFTRKGKSGYNKGEIENHKEDLNVIPLSICDKSSPSGFAHLIENEQIIFLDILFCLA